MVTDIALRRGNRVLLLLEEDDRPHALRWLSVRRQILLPAAAGNASSR